MRTLIISLLLLTLPACNRTKEVIHSLDPFEVRTEVFKACSVSLDINKYDPRTTVYADNSAAMLAAPDVDAQTKMTLAGRNQRDANILDLWTALAGCKEQLPQ